MIMTQLEKARAKVQEVKKAWKDILIVCEKKMYAEDVKKMWEKYGVSYLNYKAPGWFLTNFDTFKARIWSMNKMAAFLDTEEFSSLTKKEQQIYKRNLARAKKVYEWVATLEHKPALVIVVDGSMMKNFINELQLQKDVDSIVIADSNYDRYLWENDIIANLLSYKSVDFVMNYILS